MRSNKRTRILSIIAAALVVAAGVEFALIWHQGDIARQKAKELLAQYNSAVADTSLPPSTALSAGPDTPAPGGTSGPPSAPATPALPGASAQPSGAVVSLQGYDVIGKLLIPKIGVELPVIAKTTTTALKVSICWYCGALPGEKGNMVITGHDYANGAHFGKLNALKQGDTVEFDAPDGKKYQYAVYQAVDVAPDDVKSLEKHEGEYGLALVTCTDNGNRRLVVRCKLVQ